MGFEWAPTVHDMTWNVFDSKQKPAFHMCLQVTPPPVWNRKCCLWAAMGQRAALLLSELLLLLLTASRSLLAVSFPEDVAPLDVVDAHCEYKWAKQTEGSKSQQHNHVPRKHTFHIYYLLPELRQNAPSLAVLVVSADQVHTPHLNSQSAVLASCTAKWISFQFLWCTATTEMCWHKQPYLWHRHTTMTHWSDCREYAVLYALILFSIQLV